MSSASSVIEIPVPKPIEALAKKRILSSSLEVVMYSVIYFLLALAAGVVLNHFLPKPKPEAKLAEAAGSVALHVGAISVFAWLITIFVNILPLPDFGRDNVDIGAAKNGGVLFAGALLAAQPMLHEKIEILMTRMGSYWKWA